MSAKTSTQPGRRTPLSLSGTVTKTHPNKGGGNAVSSGNNANGHTSSNTNKQDNKLQPSKAEQQQTANSSDIKENPNKKQQQPDKKQQNDNNKKSNEKNQNGINSNKQQANENKQQQNKDKQQQQNGNDNKTNEKEKKEKLEKSDKPDKLEKPQEQVEKEETKVKDDKKLEQSKPENKKEEKKAKEVKEAKEDKKETVCKSDEKTEEQQSVKIEDKKSKEENQIENANKKSEENVENMEILEDQKLQQKSPPVTPKTNSKANKTSTPVNKTPTKASEKTPQKSTPSHAVKTTNVAKREVTTTIDDNDDIEMEPLSIESSPIKTLVTREMAHINIAPSATSTPGKIILPKRNAAVPKSDVQLAMQTGSSPERPRAFSQISGRKSIRPISDYTPSKFQSNSQFRESYRRINTELDVTNTSMNVTVGSEVPNNLSFSFFGRGRKRERTPQQHSQSAIGELQTDMEISPPKRVRLDMQGFFSAVSSPLSLLRNRFSKATLQSSTPVKLQQKLNATEDEVEVQNVSGVSVHEEIAKSDKEPAETSATANEDNDATLGEEAKETKIKSNIKTPISDQGDSEDKEFTDVSLKCENTCGMEQTCEQSDIKITETPLQPAVGDPMTKNKRCVIM